MQRLVYVPPGGSIDRPDTYAEISLASPYILGGVSGTGSAEHTVISSSIPGLDGVYIHGVRAESREISCDIHIKGNSREEMYRNRLALVRKLTASDQPGALYYYNDAVSMRIEAIPVSSPTFTNRTVNYNRAEIRFFCPSPYWESLTEKTGYMAYLDEGFTFPFAFPISFAAVVNKTSLVNEGSADTPVEITVQGPATSPKITNVTTGEWISVAHKLKDKERLLISTKRGGKRVILQHTDGTTEDAFHYITRSSTFFHLIPGPNLLKYSSADETEQTQVFIKYRELYAGV